MKGKRIFLVRPSFYAIFSGALISIAVNFFTNLFFIQKDLIDLKFIQFIIPVILNLIISSGSFLYLSLILEESREKWALSHFLNEIDTDPGLRIKLFTPFLIGAINLALSFMIITYWVFLQLSIQG